MVVGVLAGRARGRAAVLELLWECRLVVGTRAGPGALPAFAGMAKGLCVVPLPMEEEELWAGWGVRWSDAGHQSEAGPLASPFPPPGHTESAGILVSINVSLLLALPLCVLEQVPEVSWGSVFMFVKWVSMSSWRPGVNLGGSQ